MATASIVGWIAAYANLCSKGRPVNFVYALDMVILSLLLAILGLIAVIGVRLRKHLWQMQALLNRGPARSIDLEALHDKLAKHISTTTAEAVIAIQSAGALNQLGLPFPVFLGDASLDAFMARALVGTLLEHKPRVVMELGSGSSTPLIARTLLMLGVPDVLHLSVDHEAHYLELSRRLASVTGIADRVNFVHAALDVDAEDGLLWYAGLPEKLAGSTIDFLFIDGPPAHRPGTGAARYPALPRLLPYLSPSCVVLLDDANREGERDVVRRWLAEFPEFSATTATRGKGYVLLTRR